MKSLFALILTLPFLAQASSDFELVQNLNCAGKPTAVYVKKAESVIVKTGYYASQTSSDYKGEKFVASLAISPIATIKTVSDGESLEHDFVGVVIKQDLQLDAAPAGGFGKPAILRAEALLGDYDVIAHEDAWLSIHNIVTSVAHFPKLGALAPTAVAGEYTANIDWSSAEWGFGCSAMQTGTND